MLDKLLQAINLNHEATHDAKLDALYYSIIYTGDDGKTYALIELCDGALITDLADDKEDLNDSTMTFRNKLDCDVAIPLLFNRMEIVIDLNGREVSGELVEFDSRSTTYAGKS